MDLLFLHWEVSEQELRRLVPAPLSIDRFEGRAYVGLVPFTMHDVRMGPLPMGDFFETNLRTYVHAQGVPGVWFLSLDAQSALAVWGGRAFYRLPYFRATMSCTKRGGCFVLVNGAGVLQCTLNYPTCTGPVRSRPVGSDGARARRALP